MHSYTNNLKLIAKAAVRSSHFFFRSKGQQTFLVENEPQSKQKQENAVSDVSEHDAKQERKRNETKWR
jgi:hypothetical protein